MLLLIANSLAESVLLLLLVEGKDRERGEVLIHLHVILEILMTGDAAQYHVLIPVFEGQVIGDDRPFIRAGIVDIDRIYILVIGISGSDEHAIWKRSLIRIIYGKGVGGTEVRIEATFQLEATANVVFLIDLFSHRRHWCRSRRYGHSKRRRVKSDGLAQLSIMGGLDFILPVASGR